VLKFLGLQSFNEDFTKYQEESNLKNRIAALVNLNEINDKKLYKRVVLMKAKDNLEQQVNQFLDKNINL